MRIYLLRHGETEYNAQKRYQGVSDIPLSPKGLAELACADIFPKTVYVSPLLRAKQTALALFPDARQIAVPSFCEMDFGVFEGRSAMEMEHDPVYRAWVDSGCEGTIPGGERKSEFCQRTCSAFADLADQALAAGEPLLAIVAHGGTQMAVMERFARPRKAYFAWGAPNAGGFVLDAADWRETRELTLLKTVRYTKGETP